MCRVEGLGRYAEDDGNPKSMAPGGRDDGVLMNRFESSKEPRTDEAFEPLICLFPSSYLTSFCVVVVLSFARHAPGDVWLPAVVLMDWHERPGG